MNYELYKRLAKEAVYAIRSNNDCLVYQTYGKATMAFELDAISKEQFYSLNDALVCNWMNAGDKRRADYAEMIKAEDFR